MNQARRHPAEPLRILALVWLGAAAPTAPETVTVHGHRRPVQPAPMPVENSRFDRPGSVDALHDSDTGADLRTFGPAYSAATPAPPIDPALRSDLQDNPLPVGPP